MNEVVRELSAETMYVDDTVSHEIVATLTKVLISHERLAASCRSFFRDIKQVDRFTVLKTDVFLDQLLDLQLYRDMYFGEVCQELYHQFAYLLGEDTVEKFIDFIVQDLDVRWITADTLVHLQ